MLTMRRHITNVLVFILVRVSPPEITDALCRVWLERRGHVVMDRTTTEVTLASIAYTRDRIRKTGGGNASKLRDPRKTLQRLARNFERAVEQARDGVSV